jgi:hypothetical protein
MTTHLDQLQSDHATITDILRAQRDLPEDGLQVGARVLLKIYIAILEDAIAILKSLIEFLNKK